MVRQELARQLAKKAKITQRQAENIIIAFGATIREALEKGDKIVYSNFGTFYTVHYPSKIIMHPKYGAAKKMVMLPTNVAKWMPAENIKKMVASGKIIENPTMHGKKRKTETGNDSVIRHPSSVPQSEGIEIPIKRSASKKEAGIEKATQITGPDNNLVFQNNAGEPAAPATGNIAENLTPDENENTNPEDKHKTLWNRLWGDKNDETAATVETAVEKLPPFTSDYSNIAYIDLSKTTVPKEILQLIPEKIARKYKAVPIEESEGKLVLAMSDPEDIEAKEIIKKYCQKQLLIRLSSELDVNHIIDQYQGLESEVEEAIETNEDELKKDGDKQKKTLLESTLNDAPAARIVTSLLKRAIRDKASDIHIEPAEKEIQVRFRLDGILRKKVTLPKDIHLAVISRIKIMANLKIDEQRLPQDGRFSINADGHRVDFRISTMPTAYGEKVVMRVLDKSAGILTVEQLGLLGSGLDTLKANLDKSHGMILVTGPTGSGKTTTLYALIDKLFNEGVNIITLEDPIEYQVPGINQSQVNHEINYTFASGLRSIVRQDPDIIMIGEIRDSETAEMAVQAALTGHVVLSTLHTNDAAGAAPRLIDMKVEPFLLTSSLNLVIGQRLARKTCEECKEETKVSEAEIKTVNLIIAKMPAAEREKYTKAELKFFKGKGCKTCSGSGYKGRLGVYEVMAVNEPVKELVLKKASSDAIAQTAVKGGMVTMVQDGIIKAIEGITTLEEVWRVTKD